jgi:hypothetical protein
MKLEGEVLLQLLELMGIEFSYLSNEDIAIEKKMVK